MPRIPYRNADDPEIGELVEAIRARRHGALINLDRMLLHSPPFAQGWNALLGAVRRNLSIAPRVRELATCAVARLNRVDYDVSRAPRIPNRILACLRTLTNATAIFSARRSNDSAEPT